MRITFHEIIRIKPGAMQTSIALFLCPKSKKVVYLLNKNTVWISSSMRLKRLKIMKAKKLIKWLKKQERLSVNDASELIQEHDNKEAADRLFAKSDAFSEVRIYVESLIMKTESAVGKTVQLCPKCNGEGVVDNIGPLSTSSSIHRQCPACYGTKIFVL